MGRYTKSVCRLCRREGVKLYLKGERCNSPKCAVSKRAYPPGQHGLRRSKFTPYALQLREKQKAKRIYGVYENQFRRYFEIADRYRGVTGTTLLQLLERRLDNIVLRIGFAPSRPAARQMVRHGKVLVNGRKVDVPSYLVRPGEEVTLKPKTLELPAVVRSVVDLERSAGGRVRWIEYSPEKKSGRLVAVPSREEIPIELNEQLIVELYSK